MKNDKKSWKIENENLPLELVAELKQSLQSTQKELDVLPRPLAPPWQQFPDYTRTSLGWRMGAGETYLLYFREWYLNLPADKQLEYNRNAEEPDDWEGWLKSIVSRTISNPCTPHNPAFPSEW